ncbi:T-complex-associated testis-expressed protein 1, partial [Thoreauomyces humboldtii]
MPEPVAFTGPPPGPAPPPAVAPITTEKPSMEKAPSSDTVPAPSNTELHSLPPQPATVTYENNASNKQEAVANQRRVLAEDLQWNLSPVRKLSDLCINVLVSRFEDQPILSRVPLKYRERLLANISVTLPLRITAPLVPDEGYWQRKSLVTFKLCNVRAHSNSWKRLFFESNVQKMLEDFVPVVGGEQEMELMVQLELAAPYVVKLKVRQLRPVGYEVKKEGKDAGRRGDDKDVATEKKAKVGRKSDLGHPDHLNLGMVFGKLKNLEELDITYSVRDCGIDFDWEYFGITLNDTVYLTDALRTSKVLRSLTVTASSLDDNRCHLLASALMDNRTLEILNLSHNLLGDEGARALATVLTSPTTSLTRLILSNNQIGQTGGTFIANALSRNHVLTHLSLRMNHVGDKGGSAIFSALRGNDALQILDLSCNQLGSATVAAMCATLKANLRVPVSLDLSCNKLGKGDVSKDVMRGTILEPGKIPPRPVEEGHDASEDAAGKALYDAVSQNKYLSHMDLRMSGVSQEFQTAIQSI